MADPTPVITALRSALAGAMAQRDRAAMAVYRTALSAIDNAASLSLDDNHQAVAIESSARVGQTERERRALTRDDEIEILTEEVRELRASAVSLAVSRPETARRLRSDAALLQTLIDGLAVNE